jgi:hypothetical protein
MHRQAGRLVDRQQRFVFIENREVRRMRRLGWNRPPHDQLLTCLHTRCGSHVRAPAQGRLMRQNSLHTRARKARNLVMHVAVQAPAGAFGLDDKSQFQQLARHARRWYTHFMPRVRDLALGGSALSVAVGGLVLLFMVRSEAARTEAEPLDEAPAATGAAAPKGHETSATPPAPGKPAPRAPFTNPALKNPVRQAPTPNRMGAGQSSMEQVSEMEDPQEREQQIEQRKLASLERRARAIQRRMENAQLRGTPSSEKQERDQQQLDNLLVEIGEKRGAMGLPAFSLDAEK